MTQIQCPTCKLNKITSRSRITKAGVFHRQCDNKTLQRYHCQVYARRALFNELKPLVSEYCHIKSDQNPHYHKDIKNIFPKAVHTTFKGRRGEC